MKSSKTKIGVIIGIGIIVSVASMMSFPMMDSESSAKTTYQKNIKQLQTSEEKMLNFIEQEKMELESKIGGKIKLP